MYEVTGTLLDLEMQGSWRDNRRNWPSSGLLPLLPLPHITIVLYLNTLFSLSSRVCGIPIEPLSLPNDGHNSQEQWVGTIIMWTVLSISVKTGTGQVYCMPGEETQGTWVRRVGQTCEAVSSNSLLNLSPWRRGGKAELLGGKFSKPALEQWVANLGSKRYTC